MTKTYTVAYGPTFWECQIFIDWSFPHTQNAIETMIRFWSGGEGRLYTNGGDYEKTFLQQLAREISYIMAGEHHLNVEGVKDAFKNREGWCKMDGSLGIEILDVDDFSFDYSDFEVMEDPQ